MCVCVRARVCVCMCVQSGQSNYGDRRRKRSVIKMYDVCIVVPKRRVAQSVSTGLTPQFLSRRYRRHRGPTSGLRPSLCLTTAPSMHQRRSVTTSVYLSAPNLSR